MAHGSSLRLVPQRQVFSAIWRHWGGEASVNAASLRTWNQFDWMITNLTAGTGMAFLAAAVDTAGERFATRVSAAGHFLGTWYVFGRRFPTRTVTYLCTFLTDAALTWWVTGPCAEVMATREWLITNLQSEQCRYEREERGGGRRRGKG